MRARVLVLAVVAALAAAYLWRDAGSGASDGPPAAPRAQPLPARTVERAAVATPPPRNIFEYSDRGPVVAAAPPVTSAAPRAPTPFPSSAPAVRLVGLVRRHGQLKAALAIAGDTVVLAAGESAAGYTVVSIDEDEGVRVRAPDGSAVQLAPGPG